ncbi:MAG: Trk family potassium uptake protein [Clostridiales bacterium]|nr:Trk family potassium uptake protein [Clostridiales bacterium]
MDARWHPKRRLTSFQIIILGFLGVILLGALLLMLPVSSRHSGGTPFLDALFTSTSAVCVTGLVLHDTATYWSLFGQLVIMLLIQIGGMGVITVAAAFALISGRKISLMQRSTMQEAISAPKVGGIVRLTSFIIRTTLIIELLGAAAMAPVFCRDFGARGLWMALFHAVSAFCNAGFDLMGVRGEFSSLTSYAAEPVINVTVMLLILIGGIGFLTWDDIRSNRLHVRRYRMQSKVILCATGLLLLLPALYFYVFEFGALPPKERILASLFQTVTPRTAGFNTVELTKLSDAGQSITVALMLTGGSPGSTAGGMKTTTVAVLFAAAISTFQREEYPHFFRRRIDDDAVKNAATILLMYLTLFFFGGLIISVSEGLPMLTCLFEAASAVGTVGLTLGITPGLGTLSQLILIMLMFFGRVGGLTLIFAALSGRQKNGSKYPHEKVTVG